MSPATPGADLQRAALIGFGEAGSILAQDLAKLGLEVATYDILFDSPATRDVLRSKAIAVGVRPRDTLREALDGAQLVISAVTASSSSAVAAGAARSLKAGQYFLDINSVSPATKRSEARTIEASGAHYVEAAVMAAVPPQRLAVPMLLGGRKAQELEGMLRALGMNATTVASEVGTAAAIKMCRSILIKGLEALAIECLFAARAFGAEDQVLSSLDRSFPQMGWAGGLPDYLISRVAEHGARRAAEMRQVAQTLRDIGMQPTMSIATAERQQWLTDRQAALGVVYPRHTPFAWRELADALTTRVNR
jgi:3-hydroxyisobutyrate dehydrogenase-like beta-hydroxyacid dehydrogenase